LVDFVKLLEQTGTVTTDITYLCNGDAVWFLGEEWLLGR